jgi:hypothetical protein
MTIRFFDFIGVGLFQIEVECGLVTLVHLVPITDNLYMVIYKVTQHVQSR